MAWIRRSHAGASLACLLFFRNYLPGAGGGWYTGHFWSLAVEEHFYLLWPPLLLIAGVKRAGRVAVAGAVLVAAWRTVDQRYGIYEHFITGGGLPNFRSDRRMDALLWGCALAWLLRNEAARNRIARLLRWPVVTCALLLLFATLAIRPHFDLVWQALSIAVLIAATSLRPFCAAGRLLESPPARWLGRLSYSLYIWQQLFFAPYPERFARWQELPGSAVEVFLCAMASYYLVERPLMRKGRAIAAGWGT